MSEQEYFEQFRGDSIYTPLKLLFGEEPYSSPQITTLYNCLRRNGIRSIEQAVDFIQNPYGYNLRLVGVTRRENLRKMLVEYGALNA